jgi:hypothetical protein
LLFYFEKGSKRGTNSEISHIERYIEFLFFIQFWGTWYFSVTFGQGYLGNSKIQEETGTLPKALDTNHLTTTTTKIHIKIGWNIKIIINTFQQQPSCMKGGDVRCNFERGNIRTIPSNTGTCFIQKIYAPSSSLLPR